MNIGADCFLCELDANLFIEGRTWWGFEAERETMPYSD